MLLDQRRFQDESFDFVVSDDDLNIGDLLYQFNGFDAVAEVAGAARLKIRSDAIAQVLGFADIEDLACRVFVQIDAGRSGNFFEFFVERHDFREAGLSGFARNVVCVREVMWLYRKSNLDRSVWFALKPFTPKGVW